jgi:hypothetical protein
MKYGWRGAAAAKHNHRRVILKTRAHDIWCASPSCHYFMLEILWAPVPLAKMFRLSVRTDLLEEFQFK